MGLGVRGSHWGVSWVLVVVVEKEGLGGVRVQKPLLVSASSRACIEGPPRPEKTWRVLLRGVRVVPTRAVGVTVEGEVVMVRGGLFWGVDVFAVGDARVSFAGWLSE